MKTLFYSFLCLITTTILFSCNDDDAIVQEQTIAQIADATQSLSILVDALERTELVDVLNDRSQTYTVFAPDNEAFGRLLMNLGFSSLDQVDTPTLKQILLNHVVMGEFESTDLTTGYIQVSATESTTSNPLNMYVDTSGDVTLNGMSVVETPNISAANGVVHLVSEVITLPTIVTFATVDPSFDILEAALTRNSFGSTFTDLLGGTTNAPFTVFAPNNDAFVSLVEELEDVEGLEDIDDNLLTSVLQYHVVTNQNVLSSTLNDNMQVPTAQGSSFTIDTNAPVKIIDANNRESEIIATDVQASNGVVHVIKKVILP